MIINITPPREVRNTTNPFAVSTSPVASRLHNVNHLRKIFRHRKRSLTSVLDPTYVNLGSDDEQEKITIEGVPELYILDTSTSTSESTFETSFTLDNDKDRLVKTPNKPQAHGLTELGDQNVELLPAASAVTAATAHVIHKSSNSNSSTMTLSPVHRAQKTRRLSTGRASTTRNTPRPIVILADEDASSSSSISHTGSSSPAIFTQAQRLSFTNTHYPLLPSPPYPHRICSVYPSLRVASYFNMGSS